jgi:hypothetical protein
VHSHYCIECKRTRSCHNVNCLAPTVEPCAACNEFKIRVRAQVFNALDNAEDNGYPQRDLSTDEIAEHLCDCDADLEHLEPRTLYPFIEQWKRIESRVKSLTYTQFTGRWNHKALTAVLGGVLMLGGCAGRKPAKAEPPFWNECHRVAYDVKTQEETHVCTARNGKTFQIKVKQL